MSTSTSYSKGQKTVDSSSTAKPGLTIDLTSLPTWEIMKNPSSYIGKHGVSKLPAIPLRVEPSDSAEQDAQLVFGDVFTIVEVTQTGGNIKVKRAFDGVEGWMDTHVYAGCEIESDEFNFLKNEKNHGFVASHILEAENQYGMPVKPSIGGVLPHYNPSNGTFQIAGEEFRILEGKVYSAPAPKTINNLMRIVNEFAGVPYLWGGNQGYGVDCSGFTQAVSRIFGSSLKRNSSQQAEQGREIKNHEDAKTGDLATFGLKSSDRVSHLSFLVKGKELSLIHAKQGVKRQLLNEDAMYPESAEFAELKGVRRVLNFEVF